jgi:hypothetical protein
MTRTSVLKRGIIKSYTHCYANTMEHKAKVTKVLLACGLLLYAASMFLPWFYVGLIGGGTTFWSFKAEYYYTTNPPRHGEMMFFDYWSKFGWMIAIFVSQILTLIFGLLSLWKKAKGKYEFAFLELTLLFSAVSIGTCILHVIANGYVSNFLTGFSIASFAFLLLIASLLISLTNQ